MLWLIDDGITFIHGKIDKACSFVGGIQIRDIFLKNLMLPMIKKNLWPPTGESNLGLTVATLFLAHFFFKQ